MKFLLQKNYSGVEIRLVMADAMMIGNLIEFADLATLDAHAAALATGIVCPVGSVEFVQRAMVLAGITVPDNLSYPFCLNQFLHRSVTQSQIRHARLGDFVKPMTTKLFTGFILPADLGQISEHDQEQLAIFQSLPDNTSAWISEAVAWVSE